MPVALITGGTGVLGSELAPRLAGAGYSVRLMSRRAPPTDRNPLFEWAQADLATGEGLSQAVEGCDLILHCASATMRAAGAMGGRAQQAVDVDGTRRLLECAAAVASGKPRVFYVSIVGIDRIPLGYYQRKLAAEKLVEQSALPWAILRATQFHDLVDDFLRMLIRFRIALVPKDLKFQPIDAGDVAERMVSYVQDEASGRRPDLGGPEVRTLGELAQAWLTARNRRVTLLPLPTAGKVASAVRKAYNCTPEHAEGKVTWVQWLQRRYGAK